MSAISHRRATSEVVATLKGLVAGITWAPIGVEMGAAFDRVEMFDSEQMVEAFRYLLVSEQRVCVVVPLDEEFETVIEKRKLIMKRMLPVAVLISDRLLGNRSQALWGDLAGDGSGTTPGAMGLMELVLPVVTGVLLENPAGVVAEPRNVSVLAVRDTEKELPSRVTVCLELQCRGGWLEAAMPVGPIF